MNHDPEQVYRFIEQTFSIDRKPQAHPRISWSRIDADVRPSLIYETPAWNIRVLGRRPYVQIAFAEPDQIDPADLRRLFAVVDWLEARHVEFNTYYDGDIAALRRRAQARFGSSR